MTPERQKWWDSLPKEEKRIRQIYRYTKKEILNFTDHDKKYVIKALRKQIAQYPYRKDTHRVHCPNCWVWIVECYNEPPYCKYCGQKLRWQ